MFCAKCGSQVPAEARFCPACGAVADVNATYAGPYVEKHLTRPRDGRKVAGVCAGIARYMGWDATLVRVLLLVLVLGAGTGVLAYIIGWIVIPEEPYALPVGMVPPPTSPLV